MKNTIPMLRKKDVKIDGYLSYYFVRESFSRVKKIVRRDRISDLAIVDEKGLLKLAGKGVWLALVKILLSPVPDIFW